MTVRRPLHTQARAVLLATVALTPALAPLTAAAQAPRSVVEAENRLRDLLRNPGPNAAPSPVNTLPGGIGSRGSATPFERQFVGDWRGRNGTLRITEREGRAGVYVYTRAKAWDQKTEYELAAELKADSAGTALEGDWEHLNGNFQGGPWRMTMDGGELVLDGFYATPFTPITRFTRVGADSPPQPDETLDTVAKALLGRWTTPFGPIEITRRDLAGVTVVAADLADAGGGRHLLNYWPYAARLIHLKSGSDGENQMRPFRLAGDGLSFEVFGTGAGVAGSWRAFRAPAQTPAPTPPAETQTPSGPSQPTPPVQQPRPPGPSQPTPPAQPAPPQAPASGFQSLEKWDVRVDRVENPRDDRLTHVYLTLRNASTGTLLQTQGVSVRHEDRDGVVTESGQGLRAKPGRPELFGVPQPIVPPGRELKTKFVFDRNGGTARITVVEGQATADFDF